MPCSTSNCPSPRRPTRPAGGGPRHLGQPGGYQVRQRAQPEAGQAKVLGWDAAGVVRAVGSEVSLFRPGDRVWYAGDITRPGSNSERHRVDERIAGHLPKSLDFAQAAALPLTTITAWELLFERLQIAEGKADQGQSLLVVAPPAGRFDPGPTGPATDRPERDRHRFARRDPGLGPRPRRAPCDRPRQAAGRRAEADRCRRGQPRRQPDPHRPAPRTDRRRAARKAAWR